MEITTNPFAPIRRERDAEDDGFHEECGVVGVWGVSGRNDAAALTALGLHALQHRGQEAAGITSLEKGGAFHSHKGRGLVGEALQVALVEQDLTRGDAQDAEGSSRVEETRSVGPAVVHRLRSPARRRGSWPDDAEHRHWRH